MLSAAEWETFTPTINELIKWVNFQNPDLIKKRRRLINFKLKLKTHPKVRAVTRESWQSKLLGETRRTAGSQVQAGWTIAIIFDNPIQKPLQAYVHLTPQDNEFELVFVLGYQKMLALAYLDKVLPCKITMLMTSIIPYYFSCLMRYNLDFETCSWTLWKLAMSLGIFPASELTSPRCKSSTTWWFFNWHSSEFASCWSVGSRFKKKN